MSDWITFFDSDHAIYVNARHKQVHAIITGEPGVGKTCVLRALRHALGSDPAFRLTYCHNVTLGRRDFYRHVCHALNIPYGATAGDVFHSVSKHIEDLARERTIPVLLVDDDPLVRMGLRAILASYQNPVPADVMAFQIGIAAREASDGEFVPPEFRPLRNS